MFRDINDEILERDCNGLEKEELDRGIYRPFLERVVAREVDDP